MLGSRWRGGFVGLSFLVLVLGSGCAGLLDVEDPPGFPTPPDGLGQELVLEPVLAGQGVFRARADVWTGPNPLLLTGSFSYGLPAGNDEAESLIAQVYLRSPAGHRVGMVLEAAVLLSGDLSIGVLLNGDQPVPTVEVMDAAFAEDFEKGVPIEARLTSAYGPLELVLEVAYSASGGAAAPPWVRLEVAGDRPAFTTPVVANDAAAGGLLSLRDGDFDEGVTAAGLVGPLTGGVARDASATIQSTNQTWIVGVGLVPTEEDVSLGALTVAVEGVGVSAEFRAGISGSGDSFVFLYPNTSPGEWSFLLNARGFAEFFVLYADFVHGLVPPPST